MATLDKEAMKPHLSFTVALLLFLPLFLLSCGFTGSSEVDLDNINLNSLTEREYIAFNQAIYDEYQQDPQLVGEEAKEIIIGMARLENCRRACDLILTFRN